MAVAQTPHLPDQDAEYAAGIFSMSTASLTCLMPCRICLSMAEDKDPRVITPMPQALLDAIDDFRFGKRLPSRAEAIRRLIELGLRAAAEEGAASEPGIGEAETRSRSRRS